MLDLRFVPIVIYLFIALTLRVNGEDLCLQSTEGKDSLLFQSFQSMQQWFQGSLDEESKTTTAKIDKVKTNLEETKQELKKTKDLAIKLENQLKEYTKTKELTASIQSWVNNRIAEENKKVDQRFKTLEETLAQNKQQTTNLQQSVKKLQDNTELASVKKSIDELQKQANKIDETNQHVDSLQNETKKQFEEHSKLINSYKSTIIDAENKLSSCITDIRVSSVEKTMIWKGHGYEDEGNNGYFITGVINWNKDEYPDKVARRKILFRQKNDWFPVHI